MYLINEIFYSLQGEGYWSGTPMVFIRFSGCNLKCGFCDTDFLYGKEMSVNDIIFEVEKISSTCKRICITGGEPSLQIDKSFIDAFHNKGYLLHIETNGTKILPDGLDWITCSPKQDWDPKAKVVLPKIDELKLVYTGQDPKRWTELNAEHFYLQPCSCKNTKEAISYILDHPIWNLSLQIHKYIEIR